MNSTGGKLALAALPLALFLASAGHAVELNPAAVAALDDPVLRQRLIDLGQDIPPREQRTPETLRAFQKAEIEKWWPIIKAANIKAE